MIVEYRIDGEDRLEVVGPGWARFARENSSPQLAVIASPRSLWSYVSGDELTDLWQLLTARVRTQNLAVTVAFRCDGPAVRRLFMMRLTPQPDAGVRFTSTLLRAEPRPAVAVLDVEAGRDATAPLLCVCGWCNRCRDGTQWVAVERYVRDHGLLERALQPGITHGICEECAERVMCQT